MLCSYTEFGDFLVYLPDFFKGDPVCLRIADLLIPVDAGKVHWHARQPPPPSSWMTRHKAGPTDEVCQTFLRKLRRATPRDQKIGMIAVCRGGKYAIRAGLESNTIDVDGRRRRWSMRWWRCIRVI